MLREFAVSAGRNLAFDRDAKTPVNIVMNKSARGQMPHNSAQFLLCMAGIKWRVPTLQCSRDRDIRHRPSSLCQMPPLLPPTKRNFQFTLECLHASPGTPSIPCGKQRPMQHIWDTVTCVRHPSSVLAGYVSLNGAVLACGKFRSPILEERLD